MKYLKLFEQFDEDWDPFGEETIKHGKENYVEGDLVKIIGGIYTGKIGQIKKIKILSDGSIQYFIMSNGRLYGYENENSDRFRKLTPFEMRKYFENVKKNLPIIQEQLDEWDPFGEESKESDIKIGDKVKAKKLGRIGEVIRINSLNIDDFIYLVRFDIEILAFFRNEIEKIDSLEFFDIPFDEYDFDDNDFI